MNPLSRVALPISPVTKSNGGTASGTMDTKGFDFLTLDLAVTTANTTSNKPSLLTLTEGDTTSSFATFSGCVSGTDYTIPAADTSAAKVYKFNVDLKARKRYLKILISPRTTQTICAIANMSKGDESPADTTKANVCMICNV